MRSNWGLIGAIVALLWTDTARADGDNERLVVFAAASLSNVLEEQSAQWAENANAARPRLSFGASATMARQILAGAPAQLFIAANPKWTDTIEKAGRAERLAPIASNRLVLVAPYSLKWQGSFEPTARSFELLLSSRRLALADPKTAPAGAYAKNFLVKSGLWESLKNQIAYGQNVRQTLRLAERAGLPAFVYRSDAAASSRVKTLYEVPTDLSGNILYQAALMKGSSAQAGDFLAFLQSKAAARIWEKHGFSKIASN